MTHARQMVVCQGELLFRMPCQISTVYSRGSWGSWHYLCNVTQLNSTRLGSARLDSTRCGAGEAVRQAGDGGVCPNSCPLRIQPLCGRVAGNPYITYVDPDQDHSAPFMYETPAYNTLLSLARGIKLVGGGFELDHGHRQSSQITHRLELVSHR